MRLLAQKLRLEILKEEEELRALVPNTVSYETKRRQIKRKKKEEKELRVKSERPRWGLYDYKWGADVVEGDVVPWVWAEAQTRKEEKEKIEREGVTVMVMPTVLDAEPSRKGERRVFRFGGKYVLRIRDWEYWSNGSPDQSTWEGGMIDKEEFVSSLERFTNEELATIAADSAGSSE